MITTAKEYPAASKAVERFCRLDRFRNSTDTLAFWQRTMGVNSLCPDYQPKVEKVATVADYARNAMRELSELWRVKPQIILNELSAVYRKLGLANRLITSNIKISLNGYKGNYGVISLRTGTMIVKPTTPKKNYQYCCDGVRLVPLELKNGKYAVQEGLVAANDLVLVNDETELINDYRLYSSTKDLDISSYSLPHITLVQGVPGCGKTTYILKNVRDGEMVLFSTKEGAADFRERISKERDLSEDYLKEHYRTVHSYIINNVPGKKYKGMYVDEALMVHCGEVLFAAMLAGAETVFLLGDVNQIPYINRTPQCNTNYTSVSQLCGDTQYLSITYRCTNSVAALLSPFYSGGMKSVSGLRNEMKLERFTNVNALSLHVDDQVLVFTQSEKHELQKIHNKVSTIHEFQGKQAKSIVIVRSTIAKYEVFSMLSHCLVAVSRHTQRFRYVTADTADKLSSWVNRVNDMSLRELEDCMFDNHATTVAGGGFTCEVEYEVSQSYFPGVDFHQNILDCYYPWGFDQMTTKKLVPVWDANYSLPQARYMAQNYCDDLTILQTAYDTLFPGNSIHYMDFDVYRVNVIEDLELQLDDVIMDTSKLRNYSLPWYDKLKPVLRTTMPQNRPNTSIESLLAIVKRNLNVPEVQGCVFSEGLASSMYTSFVNTFIPPENREVFNQFRYMTIEPNAVNISDWLLGQISGTLGNIGLDQPLHECPLNIYQFMIKSSVKPQLDINVPYVYSSLQTIAYHPKKINAIFCPVFREIKERLLRIMSKRFMIFCDQSPDEFAETISERFDADIFDKPHMEVDMSKFDKSQGSAALDFEIMIMQAFGVPRYLTDLWYHAHHNSVLLDRDNGIQVKLVYQRKSGDASTFLGNTMFLMSVLSILFDLGSCDFAAFSGDDSLLIGESVLYDRNFLCANLFNLESKFFRHYKYKYFCSKFLLRVGDRVRFVPDLAKLLTKLGRSDLVNWEHAEEYRVSLHDLTSVYSDARINEAFEAALRERYECDNLCLPQTLSVIRFLLSSKSHFSRLFYMVPGAKLCHDPSRPTLD